jgi:hypothetical protein
MPTPASSGPTTFAYQRALLHRLPEHKLAPGSSCDIQAYTPTFIHDSLMLPGSLAHVIGKVTDPIPSSKTKKKSNPPF